MAGRKGPLSEQLRFLRIGYRHVTHTDLDPIIRRFNRYVASHSAIVDDLAPQRVARSRGVKPGGLRGAVLRPTI